MATAYKVLLKGEGGWEVVADEVEAPSANAAIRKVAEKMKLEVGDFVAPPVRSWKPVSLKLSTRLTLT